MAGFSPRSVCECRLRQLPIFAQTALIFARSPNWPLPNPDHLIHLNEVRTSVFFPRKYIQPARAARAIISSIRANPPACRRSHSPPLLRLSLPAMVGMMTQGAYYFVDRVVCRSGVESRRAGGHHDGFSLHARPAGRGDADRFWRRGPGLDQAGRKEDGRGRAGLGQRCAVARARFRGSHGRRAVLAWTRSCMAWAFPRTYCRYTHDYLQIIIFATGFQLVGFGLNAVIRAEGNARTAMWTLLIGVFLNFVLAWLFLFKFHWGIAWARHWPRQSPKACRPSGCWPIFSGGKSMLRLHWRISCGSTARHAAGSC